MSSLSAAAARQEAGFMAEMSPHSVQLSVASQQPHTSTDLAAVAAAVTLAAGVWWSSPSEAQAST